MKTISDFKSVAIRAAFTVLTSGLISAGLTSCSSAPKAAENSCLQRRGSIDIGSGSTKAYAAVIDVCSTPKKIVEKLFDSKVKISFGEALEQNAEGKIP